MSQVIALIPARSGSKGIQGKNFRRFDGLLTLTSIAVGCGISAGCDVVALSSDVEPNEPAWWSGSPLRPWIDRPTALAQDDTPMIAVVQHALDAIPGKTDDIIVLLQPTQPFRTPGHVTRAIQQLRETQADSVVSVVEAHPTHHVAFQLRTTRGGLVPWLSDWAELPTCRQAVGPTYLRDGTVYAFWRRTVTTYGTIYGEDVRALVIVPEDTCKLDTEADWDDVARRWDARLSKP